MTLEKFKKFMDCITDNDKIAIFHDTDMDGFAAGVLAKKGLQKLNKNIVATVPKDNDGRNVTDDLIEKFADATVIVCVDLALENFGDAHRLANKKVLVLDHHPTKEPYEQSFTLIKPEHIQSRVRNFQYCAAHLVYTLFDSMIDMSEHDWIALAGIVGDMTSPHHVDFIQRIMMRHGWKYNEDMYETSIGDVVKQIGYGCALGSEESVNRIFTALDTATSVESVVSALNMFNPVKEEQQKLLDRFSTHKQTYGSVHFYDIITEYSLASPVSSILSKKYVSEHEILITMRSSDNGMTSASARRQDCQLHMGEMMGDCIKSFDNSNGGGHIPAAGAKFPTKYKQQFKENILQWVKDNE